MENSILEEAIISVHEFICRVSDKDGPKTDAEVAVLPEMVTKLMVLLSYKNAEK